MNPITQMLQRLFDIQSSIVYKCMIDGRCIMTNIVLHLKSYRMALIVAHMVVSMQLSTYLTKEQNEETTAL